MLDDTNYENESTVIIQLDSSHDSMRNILQQFLRTFSQRKVFDDDFNTETLQTIEDVFELLTKSGHNGCVHLIVVVYEFEKFNMNLLNKFITIIRSFISDVPLGFIFFKQNLFNANLNNYLPMDTIDHLYVRIDDDGFRKSSILSLFIDIIQDNNLQIKFHPTLIEKLSENFERIEFSFENFRNLMHLIVFNYFNQNPLSLICDANFQSYNDDNLTLCFRNSLNIRSLQQIPFDDEYMNNLSKCYQELLKKNSQLMQCLNIILQLFSDLSIPIEQFPYHYSQFFTNKTSSEKCGENLHLERLYDVTQNRIKNALEKLKFSNQHLNNNPIWKAIDSHLVKLDELINRDKVEQEKQKESIRQLGLECQVEMVKDKLRHINSRYEWKRTLKPMAKQNLSHYEQWKNNFICNLEQLFADFQFNNDERSLIDALFCDMFPINHLSYRLNIDKALAKPTGKNSAALGNSYPSFYIIYKLYKESGNNVNLTDWYEKFCEEKNLSANSQVNNEEMFMAWFLNTILDFEFIGLLKSCTHNKYSKIVYL